MKISLVTPFKLDFPPMGLITVAASLIDKGHDVEIFEGFVGDCSKSDMVGFSGLSIWLNQIRGLTNRVPKETTKVIGGPCITAYPSVFNSLNVDYGIVGEGEETICELAEYISHSKIHSLSEIKGLLSHRWSFKPRPFMDLSKKPIPAWYLLKNLDYKSGLGVETSRGCPFNCVFCSAHLICGKVWRPRKPSAVIDEIEVVVDKYKPRRIYFPDDNCTVDPKRWRELLKMLIQRDFGVVFHIPEGIQAHHLDMATLQMMKDANFEGIWIGAESGVQRVLDNVIHKGGLTVQRIEQVVKDCVKINLPISCFFVIGIPGETCEEMVQTVGFASYLRKLGAYNCSVRNCLPVLGTEIWDIAKKNGNLLITEEQAQDHKFLHSDSHFFITSEWTPRQVERLVKRSQKENKRHLRMVKFKRGIKKVLGD